MASSSSRQLFGPSRPITGPAVNPAAVAAEGLAAFAAPAQTGREKRAAMMAAAYQEVEKAAADQKVAEAAAAAAAAPALVADGELSYSALLNQQAAALRAANTPEMRAAMAAEAAKYGPATPAPGQLGFGQQFPELVRRSVATLGPPVKPNPPPAAQPGVLQRFRLGRRQPTNTSTVENGGLTPQQRAKLNKANAERAKTMAKGINAMTANLMASAPAALNNKGGRRITRKKQRKYKKRTLRRATKPARKTRRRN